MIEWHEAPEVQTKPKKSVSVGLALTLSWIIGFFRALVFFCLSGLAVHFFQIIWDQGSTFWRLSWLLLAALGIFLVLGLVASDVLGSSRVKIHLGPVASTVIYLHMPAIFWASGLSPHSESWLHPLTFCVLCLAPLVPLAGIFKSFRSSSTFYHAYKNSFVDRDAMNWNLWFLGFKVVLTLVLATWFIAVHLTDGLWTIAGFSLRRISFFSWLILLMDCWFPSVLHRPIKTYKDTFYGLVRTWFLVQFIAFNFIVDGELRVSNHLLLSCSAITIGVGINHGLVRRNEVLHQLQVLFLSGTEKLLPDGTTQRRYSVKVFIGSVQSVKTMVWKVFYWVVVSIVSCGRLLGSLATDKAFMMVLLFCSFHIFWKGFQQGFIGANASLNGPLKIAFNLAMNMQSELLDQISYNDLEEVKELAILWPQARSSIWSIANLIIRSKKFLALITNLFSTSGFASVSLLASAPLLALVLIPVLFSLLPFTRMWDEFKWITDSSVTWVIGTLATMVNLGVLITTRAILIDKTLNLPFLEIDVQVHEGVGTMINGQWLVLLACSLLLLKSYTELGTSEFSADHTRSGLNVVARDKRIMVAGGKFSLDRRNLNLSFKVVSLLLFVVAIAIGIKSFQMSWFKTEIMIAPATQVQVLILAEELADQFSDMRDELDQFGTPVSAFLELLAPINEIIEDIPLVGKPIEDAIDAIEDLVVSVANIVNVLAMDAVKIAIPILEPVYNLMNSIANAFKIDFTIQKPDLGFNEYLFALAMMMIVLMVSTTGIMLILFDHDVFHTAAQTLLLPVLYNLVLLVSTFTMLQSMLDFKNSFFSVKVEMDAGCTYFITAVLCASGALLLGACEDPDEGVRLNYMIQEEQQEEDEHQHFIEQELHGKRHQKKQEEEASEDVV